VDHICYSIRGQASRWNVGRVDFQLEWGLRRTYTDYIDDVSTTYVDRDLNWPSRTVPLAATFADPSVLGRAARLPQRSPGPRRCGHTRLVPVHRAIGHLHHQSRFSDCDEQYNWMRKRR
jgi:hypothetical protein